MFPFTGHPPKDDLKLSKRNFLRKISSLFDPMGFLTPFTVQAKFILQEMWTSGLDWNDTIDENLKAKPFSWFHQLEQLNQIKVPRSLRLVSEEVVSSSLHTLVDASSQAYGAVVYARYVFSKWSIVAPFNLSEI